MRTWERDDHDLTRPIAAPLDRCAELLGTDLATVRKAAANVEPYIRADGTKVWSLMQLERMFEHHSDQQECRLHHHRNLSCLPRPSDGPDTAPTSGVTRLDRCPVQCW